MLARFNIQHKVYISPISQKSGTDFNKILGWVGDNATSNDTQNTALGDNPNNAFDSANRVRCFAHTLNLAVSAFLRPFSPPSKKKKKGTAAGDDEGSEDEEDETSPFILEDDDDMPDLVSVSSVDGGEEDDERDTSAWDAMDIQEREELLKETDSVKQVITRVCDHSLL
jgi:hypothetical protein